MANNDGTVSWRNGPNDPVMATCQNCGQIVWIQNWKVGAMNNASDPMSKGNAPCIKGCTHYWGFEYSSK